MPSWGMHLLVAKKLNEKINIEDYNSFLIGNLIPDLNNGFVVPDISKKMKHKKTHYQLEEPIVVNGKNVFYDINKFIIDNNEDYSNIVVIGYITHLLTDLHFNNLTYSIHSVYDENNNMIGVKDLDGNELIIGQEGRRRRKVEDFCIYVDYLYRNKLVDRPHYSLKAYRCIDKLTNIQVEKNDLKKMIKYLNSTKKGIELKRTGYIIFSKEELDSEIEKCVETIIGKLVDMGIVIKKGEKYEIKTK